MKKLIWAFAHFILFALPIMLTSCGCSHLSREYYVKTEPTYVDSGALWARCLDCDDKDYYAFELYAFRDGKGYEVTVVTEPTCTVDGYSKYVYTFNEFSFEFESVVPASHSVTNVARVEPTCTEAGYSEGQKCTVCGETTYGIIELAPKGHTYKDGVCEICTEKQVITVTYVTDAGSESVTYAYGDSFVEKELTGTPDSAFCGWYNSSGTVKYTYETVLTDDLYVYAKFDTSIPVGTKEEFLAIFENPNKTYHLTADINLRGEVLEPVALFSGVLDGRGHEVKNFSVSTNEAGTALGLIGTNEGTLTNIVFRDYIFNLNVSGVPDNAAIGGLVGHNKGRISDIKLEATVNTSVSYTFGSDGYKLNIGGLVGVNDSVLENLELNYVYNVYTNTYNPIYGIAYPDRGCSYNVGRVVGVNNGEMSEIFDTGDMTLDVELGLYWLANVYVTTNVGGLVAHNNGSIERSYHTGDIRYEPDANYGGYEHESATVGGFVGLNDGEITESFTENTFIGGAKESFNLGGFVGKNSGKAKISSCYCDSAISTHVEGSNAVGGFAGRNDALVQNCYSAGEIQCSVGATLGGFVGINEAGGTVSRSYTKTAVNAGSWRSGRFAADNHAIISKCYYLDTNLYNPRESVPGDLAVTTEINEITFEELVSIAVMKDRLYWDEEGWTVSGTAEPTLTWRSGQ